MEDEKILELYWNREETAIDETRCRYSAMLFSVAERILHDRQDAEECENDTYMTAWNNIPPLRPDNFKAYLAKIVRNHAIDRLRKNLAEKRGGNSVTASYEELDECIPGRAESGQLADEELRECLNAFLQKLPKEKRVLFLKRYWMSYSIAELAKQTGQKEKQIKNSLYQLRKKLKKYLEKAGKLNG